MKCQCPVTIIAYTYLCSHQQVEKVANKHFYMYIHMIESPAVGSKYVTV